MDNIFKIDALDEALRVISLESAKEAENIATGREVQLMFSVEPNITMSDNKRVLMMQKLNTIVSSISFGQLLQQAMQNVETTEDLIAEKVKLPVQVLRDLANDNIYTNNVPIILFKNLISALNLPFKSIESSIKKTFEILQSRSGANNSFSGFSPAFRKSYHTKEAYAGKASKTDGKELYENKEALEKYLSRLDELMK